MKNLQKGFSVIELVLVLVIVGTVVLIGMNVANRQDSGDNNSTPVATQTDEINNAQDLESAEDDLNDLNLEDLDTSELDAAEADLL